jgi:hypothetical protein
MQVVQSHCRHPHRQTTLWSPILTNLTKLSFVAEQPLKAHTYHRAPSLEQETERWIKWLRPILKFMMQQVSGTCILEVDDNDTKETSALF